VNNTPAYVPAYVFIPLFILGVVIFGFSIWFLATRLYEKLSPKRYLIGILIIIGGIVGGVVLMFQPFVLEGFKAGFWVVLISLVLFMYWSHIQPRTRQKTPSVTENGASPALEAGGVSTPEG
jgi:hypothetical protein